MFDLLADDAVVLAVVVEEETVAVAAWLILMMGARLLRTTLAFLFNWLLSATCCLYKAKLSLKCFISLKYFDEDECGGDDDDGEDVDEMQLQFADILDFDVVSMPSIKFARMLSQDFISRQRRIARTTTKTKQVNL